MNKELVDTFFETLNFRSTTSWLSAYASFFIAYHWQAFYVTFFVDEKLIEQNHHLLKNEYISTFISSHGWYDWSFYLGIIVPGIYTAIFIWILPNLLFIHAFNEGRNYKLKKKIRIAQDEHSLLLERAKIAKSNQEIVEVELDTAKAENEIVQLDPTKQYEIEYKKFREGYINAGNILERIKTVIYTNNGNTKDYNDEGVWVTPNINAEDLAIGDTNGIIIIKPNNRIELTEKGRFFVMQELQSSGGLPF